MPFWGGVGERTLRQFCKRFDLDRGDGWHGFVLGRKRVLYRRGYLFPVKPQSPNAREHWRLAWKNPLGNPREYGKFTHVLLHAPKAHGFEERFFFFEEAELRKLAKTYREFRKGFAIPADPDTRPDKRSMAKRDILANHMISRLPKS